MSVDSRQHVDVRFFGAHDRAWVPATHCILFSDKDPNKSKGSTPTNTKNASKTQKGIADAMKEKDMYIDKLRELYGFRYASSRQAIDPNNLQGHIEYMLPGLKSPKEVNGVDTEGTQKEKLTLKLVKGQSSNNYQVEPKSAEPRTPQPQKQSEKPKLYKVMSKNDDNADTDQSGKLQLIIKRKSVVEQESEKVKKVKVSDTSSEASENSVSTKGTRLYRRKSTKEVVAKHKKAVKKEENENASEPASKRAKHNDKQKQSEPPDESFPEGAPKPKAVRRYRLKSVLPEADKPLVVSRVAPLLVPPGTDEIEELRDDSSSSSRSSKPSNNRGKNGQRSRSIEKEPEQSSKRLNRARSVSITAVPRKPAPPEVKEKASSQENVPKDPQPSTSAQKPPEEIPFNPNLVIKDEPLSDCEEILERNTITEKDLQSLNRSSDKRVKKTTIVISTVDNEPSSTLKQQPTQQQQPRARKTFPNQPNQLQLEGLITPAGPGRTDWMVCIPQSFSGSNLSSTGQSPPTSNRSTPASEPQLSISHVRPSQVSVSRNASTVIGSNSNISVSPASNRSQNLNIVPPLGFNSQNETTLHRRDSIQSNQVFVNGQRHQNSNQSSFSHQRPLPELTRIAPRPQGVFANDGSLFNRDVGPVSRMLTDNAHRISDFFRTVLVDSISAFAPDTPSAENMMLRAEKEKLQRDMQVTKSECQQTMQQLRQEHNEYLEGIKKRHGELCDSKT